MEAGSIGDFPSRLVWKEGLFNNLFVCLTRNRSQAKRSQTKGNIVKIRSRNLRNKKEIITYYPVNLGYYTKLERMKYKGFNH